MIEFTRCIANKNANTNYSVLRAVYRLFCKKIIFNNSLYFTKKV